MFRHSRGSKAVSFLFFGGEPLLNWDGIVAVVELAEGLAGETGREPSFSMTTNGTLMTAARLAFLRDHNVRFLLSIDGDEATHDAHRRKVAIPEEATGEDAA